MTTRARPPASPFRGRAPRAAFACLLLLAAALLGATAAPAAVSAPDAACVPRHVDGLGPACPRGDGLWDVLLADGSRMPTHGPDPLVHDHGTWMGPSDPLRAPVCATDHYQHVLYGRSASQPDRLAQVKVQIVAAIHRMNHVLNEDAIESGGVNADYKVLCDADGAVRVDSFVVAGTAVDFSDVVNAAMRAGFNKPNVDYTIFFDRSHPSYCGVGTLHGDSAPGPENRNNGGGYGVTYAGCWDGRTVMHENGHNQGAVQDLAPGWDGDAHCIEQYDVMCYWYAYNQYACLDRVRFDCGYDTYFDAEPEPGEWLSLRWNLGSRANRFLRFGDQSPTPPGPPALAGAEGDAQAILSWETPHAGDAPTAYEVYRDGVLHQQLGPQAGFTDAGLVNGQTYRYQVRATNVAGASPLSNEVAVTPRVANQPPTACFTLATTSAATTVDASCSSDPDGALVQWSWSWGDGLPNATGPQASHSYLAAGTYALRLAVTDDRGGVSTLTQNVSIAAPQDPAPGVPTLVRNEPYPDSLGGAGAWRYYKVPPSAASGATIEIRGSGCVRLLCDPDLDLFVKRGAAPTTTAFDCRAAENGQAETCIASGGDWIYVGVHVESGSATGSYTVRAYW